MAAAPVPLPIAKTAKPVTVVDVKPSMPAVALQQKKTSEKTKSQTVVNEVVATSVEEARPNGKRGRKTRANGPVANNGDAAPNTEIAAVAPAVATKVSNVSAETASDALVKQFLQRFSRVYEEGDYFALHNLFTRDLAILGAPPQRSVLRSYRQLFENSESREISLDHVTWLTSDEHIVVIASYQAQVMPRGKGEALSSRGDIRLDLRVENGQLRIIRLQSDIKNG